MLGMTNYLTDCFDLWDVGKKVLCLQCGFKVDTVREILTVIMTSYDENVRLCKRHTVVRRARFVFGDRFALSWPFDSLP